MLSHMQMGISEVGIRKKIIASIAEVHKKEWHMPTNALPYGKALRYVHMRYTHMLYVADITED